MAPTTKGNSNTPEKIQELVSKRQQGQQAQSDQSEVLNLQALYPAIHCAVLLQSRLKRLSVAAAYFFNVVEMQQHVRVCLTVR